MHSLLEAYLEDVATHLSALPPKRRAEELREVRTHLENAVIVGRELGQSEDEAAQVALTQFGTPHDLGENLVWAWRREETLNRRSLFGAAACTAAILYLMSFLVMKLFLEPSLGHSMSHAQMTAHAWTYLVCFGLIVPVSTGIAGAVFFSKKAVLGAVLGATVFYGWYLLRHVTANIVVDPHSFHLSPLFFVGEAYMSVEAIFVTLFAAWAISRLRMAGQRRRYQAAAK